MTMTRYDVSNEAIVAATPADVISAFAAEAAGRSHWWEPLVLMRQRGRRPLPEIGAAVDLVVRLDQRWAAVRVSARVTAFDVDRRLVLEYFDGDMRGTEEWTVEPLDAGHTRIVTRWRAQLLGAVGMAARFVDVPAGYSKVMREGFRAIERYTARAG
jgi:hypothetical protein